MASNITRDHHNLRRNLNLNSNYISNDGGDEGISIADDGDVTLTSNDTQLKIAYDGSNYTTMEVDDDGDFTIETTGDSEHMKLYPSGSLYFGIGSGLIYLHGFNNYSYGIINLQTNHVLKVITTTDTDILL